ncbi:molecular chaperone [Paenibacillus vortex V453]|jgi:HSP20 family protein|uniref:SHSP domain-containing protein n=2 Tax=Paenibacillus TaxID=44249 RepID=A0A163ISU9_9BACL|nr:MULTISPECIES: Hsp20/alpha crystallin family protein [Paenibacillus]ANA80099.1 hypothetical protein A3958_08945 [Paenibacillus glucanolyticus]AVV55877.1 Hsp20/alpha crystallin family protein [Paenibacillus glucanolyticus]AWP30408.1 hypothetical protein B9D94_29065 [Paenibacillus sp. Cedars]EFU43826.1 molecular chaperone [Paenibacillus vortex V453]ETT38492.1 small heat shock protein [Paenibacillus sp. FSL R5-808]
MEERIKTNTPKDFYSQVTEVLGDDFWSEMSELLPNSGPRIDVFHTSTTVVVLVELPGLESVEQIRLQLIGQTLELEGDLPCHYPVTGPRITISERFFGPFCRSLALPKPVSAEAISAKYTKGLLVVVLQIIQDENQTPIQVDFERS